MYPSTKLHSDRLQKELNSIEKDPYIDNEMKKILDLASSKDFSSNEIFPELVTSCLRSNWQQMKIYIPRKAAIGK